MPSLGDLAAGVRVRPLTGAEAYLLGALHLQGRRRAGAGPTPGTPGHVQRVAERWSEHGESLPAWVAEHEEQHVGMAIARVAALPGSDEHPRLIHLSATTEPEQLADAVCLALVRTVVGWARGTGAARIDVADDVLVPGPVLDAARADVRTARRVSLPTRA